MNTPILHSVRQRGRRTTRRVVRTGSWLWFRANRRTARLPAYLAKALLRFRAEDQHRAIAFSYWGLLSLFPLVLLLIVVDTSFHSLWFARQEIFATLDNFIPAGAGQFIQNSIVGVWYRQDLFGVVSLIGLGLGATRMFSHLQGAVRHIFRDRHRRGFFRQVLLSLIMLGALLGILIVWPRVVSLLAQLHVNVSTPATRYRVAQIGSLLAYAAFLAFIFWWMPDRKAHWSPILVSALGGAGLLVLLRQVFDWYLTAVMHPSNIYGAAAALIGLSIWLFAVGNLILISAELAVALDDWRRFRIRRIQPPVPIPGPENI